MNDNPQTIQDVEAIAAKLGHTFSPDDYAQANQRAEQRTRQLEAQTSAESTKRGLAAIVEAFNRFYPKFLQALLAVGDVLITGVHTVLIAFGVPTLLIALMTVEQQRVFFGAMLIDGRESLATGIAWVLVLANLVAELIVHWEEHRKGWTEPARYDFSLRIVWQRIGYLLGINTAWAPREKSPAFWARLILRCITVTILALAVAGSMQAAMNSTGAVNWADALVLIVTRSTLLQMVTWIGGLMLAFTFVISAQGFSQYVAKKVIEIVAIMQGNADDKPRQMAEAAGLTAAMYLYGRLKENQRARRISAVTAADMIRDTGAISGTIPVTMTDDVPEPTEGEPSKPKRSKIDTAVEMLTNDRTLRKLTTRELEEKTGIGRNTWATAKKRLGL